MARLVLVYPFVDWWAFALFQLFASWEQCCFEHSHTSFCVDMHSYFSWACMPKSEIDGSCRFPFYFLRNCRTVFHNGRSRFTSPPVSSAGVLRPHQNSRSGRPPGCEVVFPCGLICVFLMTVVLSVFSRADCRFVDLRRSVCLEFCLYFCRVICLFVVEL